jgi:hypothetical protein
VIFEGPGQSGKAIQREDIEWAKKLRQRGLRARKK